MITNNCIYCEKATQNMNGKLVIEVKVPDNMILYDHIYVSQVDGLFRVRLCAGSTYIYDIREEMKIYAYMESCRNDKTNSIKVSPEGFYHIIIDYEYYYYQNQPRVKNVRWQQVEHIGKNYLYDKR